MLKKHYLLLSIGLLVSFLFFQNCASPLETIPSADVIASPGQRVTDANDEYIMSRDRLSTGTAVQSLLRSPNASEDCFLTNYAFVDPTRPEKKGLAGSTCPSSKYNRPFWTMSVVGWPENLRNPSSGPGFAFDVVSRGLTPEFDLINSASAHWNGTADAAFEPGNTEQCALREVGLQFDWVDASFKRTPAWTEPSLADFSEVFVSVDAKTTSATARSSCSNFHNSFSIDFIYDYVDANGKTMVTNALHLLISPPDQEKDHFGTESDEVTFAECYDHAIYKIRVCSVMARADKWGINILSDRPMSDYKNINTDFLPLIRHYEKAGLLETCSSCGGGWSAARIRHIQFVNSVRSGDRFVRIKKPNVFVRNVK